MQVRYRRIKGYLQVPYKLTNATLDGGTALKYETWFVDITIFQDRNDFNMTVYYHVYITVIILQSIINVITSRATINLKHFLWTGAKQYFVKVIVDLHKSCVPIEPGKSIYHHHRHHFLQEITFFSSTSASTIPLNSSSHSPLAEALDLHPSVSWLSFR